MGRPVGLEPTAPDLENRCSLQLSYGRRNRLLRLDLNQRPHRYERRALGHAELRSTEMTDDTDTRTLMRHVYLANQERLPMFVIYDHPSDFPETFVARLHFTFPDHRPTPLIMTHKTLTGLRAMMPPECVMVGRSPGDDPKIVETWL